MRNLQGCLWWIDERRVVVISTLNSLVLIVTIVVVSFHLQRPKSPQVYAQERQEDSVSERSRRKVEERPAPPPRTGQDSLREPARTPDGSNVQKRGAQRVRGVRVKPQRRRRVSVRSQGAAPRRGKTSPDPAR